MRSFIPVLSALLFCSSCTTFQYVTLEQNTVPDTGKKFTTITDSIEVGYQFSGYNAVLLLDITNKRSTPVTVNWKRSAIITNGVSVSLYNPQLPLTASTAYDTLNNALAVRNSTVTGSILVPGESDFIPPHAAVQKKTMPGFSGPFALQLNSAEKITRTTVQQDKITLSGKHLHPPTHPAT